MIATNSLQCTVRYRRHRVGIDRLQVELVLSILTQPSALMCIILTVLSSDVKTNDILCDCGVVVPCAIPGFTFCGHCCCWVFAEVTLERCYDGGSFGYSEVITWVLFLKKNEDPDWAPKIGGVVLSPMQRWLLLVTCPENWNLVLRHIWSWYPKVPLNHPF